MSSYNKIKKIKINRGSEYQNKPTCTSTDRSHEIDDYYYY
jgi:hypothetical protein